MSDLTFGERAKVALNPGQILRVTTSGVAEVEILEGGPLGTTTVTASSREFGPYSVAARLIVESVGGTVTYGLNDYVPALTAQQVGALAAVTGGDKTLLSGASAGASSAWVPYIAGMRLAWQLDSGTTSTTFSIDISADGVTSLAQAYTGVWASSTVAEISPPLYLTNPLARFIRFNVLTGGPLSVDRSV